MPTCIAFRCVHRNYCCLDATTDYLLCVNICEDPTVMGLIFADPQTVSLALRYLKAEIMHMKINRVDWKTALQIYKEMYKSAPKKQ